MANQPWAGRAAGAGRHCPDERWQLIWSQREHLLKVARRRSVSHEDAEDAVHEAMLRAVERPHLDAQRLPAWLTTVTIRLCVDRHRQVDREAEVGNRATLVAPAPAPVEEVVCDRDEAGWVARRSGELPGRQAEALWLKSEELDVGQVARRMGLSYRTVESLLARARRTLRDSLAGTLAVGLWLFGRGRPRTGGGGLQSVAVVSTVATLTVLGIAVPGVYDGTAPGEDRQRPSAAGSPAGGGDQTAAGRHRAALAPLPGTGVPEGTSPLLPEALPPLPSLPALRVGAAPQVAELPPLASLLGLVGAASATSVPPLTVGGGAGAGGTPPAEELQPGPTAPSAPPDDGAAPPVAEDASGVPGTVDGAGRTGGDRPSSGEPAGSGPSSGTGFPDASGVTGAPDVEGTADDPGTAGVTPP